MAETAIRTAVVLIAHGSRNEPANAELRELAERLAASGRYPIVEPAFLELAEPEIGTAGDRCVEQGAARVLMVPYFLSMGVHLIRDLTAAREDLSRRHPEIAFLLGPPLGPDPLLEQLVEKRVERLDRGLDVPIRSRSEEAATRFAPLVDHDPQ